MLLQNLTTFRSLTNVDFRFYFANNLVSQAAGNMQAMARSLLVYRLTDSAALLGLATVLNFIPLIFLSPIGGLIADRFKKKHVVIAGQVMLIFMALLLAIPLSLGYLESGHPSSWWILAVAYLVDGTCMGLTGPSYQAMVREIVGAERVMNAVALGSLAMNILRFVAPLATGFIISGFGFATVFYIMAGLYLVGMIFFTFIPAVAPHISGTKGVKQAVTDIKEGFKYVRGQPTLMYILVFFSVAIVLSMPYGSLMPIFADDILKVGETGLGILISVSGIGATVVSVVLASMTNKSRGMIMLAGSILLGAALAGFAFSTIWGLSLVLIFIVGLADTARNTVSNTLLLYYSEHSYWGRVMSVQAMVFGLSSVGVLLASLAVQRFGVQWVVGSLAVVLVLFSAAATIAMPRLRRLD